MISHHHIVSRGHTRPLTEINFVEDGNDRVLLISSAHDKLPQIRNGNTGDWIGTFQGHKGAVWSAKIDSTRTLTATASGDFTAKLWCTSTGKELYELKHRHVVKSIDFSKDSMKITTGCQDGMVRVFETIHPEAAPLDFPVKDSNNASTSVNKVVFFQDSVSGSNGYLVLAGKKCGQIDLFDTRQTGGAGPVLTSAIPQSSAIMDIEMNYQHNAIFVTSGRKVCMLDSKTLSLVKEYAMPDPLSFVEEGGTSMSPDGSTFITGGSDLWLREFDCKTGELQRTFKGHHGPVRCVRFHPNGKRVASGSEDGTIRLWDLSQHSLDK